MRVSRDLHRSFQKESTHESFVIIETKIHNPSILQIVNRPGTPLVQDLLVDVEAPEICEGIDPVDTKGISGARRVS